MNQPHHMLPYLAHAEPYHKPEYFGTPVIDWILLLSIVAIVVWIACTADTE